MHTGSSRIFAVGGIKPDAYGDKIKSSPERRSARISEIKNGRLDLYGTEHFEM